MSRTTNEADSRAFLESEDAQETSTAEALKRLIVVVHSHMPAFLIEFMFEVGTDFSRSRWQKCSQLSMGNVVLSTR